MRHQLIAVVNSLALVMLFTTCASEKEPLPELTYFGEEPKIQNPLSPEASQRHIQLPDGFHVDLFAAEPNIINPIALAWDERGRLWVVQSMDYPHGLDNEVGGDRITICEDTDGDGKADKFTDFAIEQSLSTGITIVKGGAIVAQAPEMVFLEDTDGDDVMDKRTVLFDGFGTWDTHAGPANLKYGLDNKIWGSVGYSAFENRFGDQDIKFTMGVYRFSKDGQSFEPVGRFNNNTWGLGFNENFEVFGSTANNNHACFVGIPLRYYDYLDKRPSWAINSDFIQGHYEISPVDTIPLQQVDVRGGYTAAAGANFYLANNYPKSYRNQMYVNAPTGHLVHIARMEEEGAGYKEVDGGNIFASTDAWTAPVYTETGPDGNLWVADWYNPVIQHNPDARGMDNQIWNDDKGEGNAHLNEHRDKRHGRIYIIKHKSNKKSAITSLSPENTKDLLKGLQSNNVFWRTTAQRLIVEHQLTELISDLKKIASKDNTHALWALDGLNALEEEHTLIENALSSSVEGMQRAALALLPETESGSEILLNSGLLEDDNLRIRLTAILRASELPENDAMYQKLESIASDKINNEDKWLKAAIKIYFREQNYEAIEADEVVMLIPSAEEAKSEWKYTTEKPSNNWVESDFDDSPWKEGTSVIGQPNRATNWDTEHIWMRKTVTLEEIIEKPVLKVLHDEDYEVYVNGELLFKEKGYTWNYRFIRLDTDLGKLFKKGKNTLAVYCHNGNGAQHIDVGIGKVGEFKADRQLVLNTVSQKMAYDKTVLHAMAGEQVEIIINNVDQMPHNLILIEKGSLDAFGKIVDEFLLTPEAAEREYIPKSRYVLAASEMLDPGEKGIIRLKMPDEPGDYPFICTFPGHWRIMQGILKVSPKGTYVSDDPNALKIASMAGGGSHDFLRFFGIADGKIMSQNGKNTVQYTENSKQLEEYLKTADVLVISNNKAFKESTKVAILDHVNQGKSMLIYHPSTWYNWKNWSIYNRELVGGGSESHEPLQEFEVKVTKPNHPIMKGVPRTFRITDELYRWKRDPQGSKIEVLAVGKGLESGEEFPVVWVIKHPKAKIIGNTLGHDADAHYLKAYQTILENSLNWVKAEKNVLQ